MGKVNALLQNMTDVRQFDEIRTVILAEDKGIALWHLERLHWKCAQILENTDAATSALHRWKALVFGAKPVEPVRHNGHGLVLKDHSRSGDPFDHWKDFPPAAYTLYWEAAHVEEIPIIRTQYFAVLWETRTLWRKIEPRVSFTIQDVAAKLITSCVQSLLPETRKQVNLWAAGREATLYFEIAAYIASRFEDYSEVTATLPAIMEFAEQLIEDAPHWSVGLAEVITFLAQPKGKVRKPDVVSDAELARIQEILKKVQIKYDSEPGHDGPEPVLEAIIRVEALRGVKVTQQDYERRLAEGYLKRASLPWPNFVKATFLKDAAAHFHAAGMREEASRAKLQSREAVQKAHENKEFKTISISRTIPMETIDQILEPFFEGATEAYEILLRTTQRLFAVSIESGQTPTPFSSLAHHIPAVPIVDDRVKATQVPGDDGINDHVVKQGWAREVAIQSRIPLSVIFAKLRDEYDLAFDDLYSVLSASQLWRPQDLPFLKKAVERFLANDYISCIHVLVPRLEQLIRLMLLAVGADVTAYREGDLRERPLGELLREASEKNFMPVKLVQLLQTVLSEEWGMNLRNRVAHGLINEAECDAEVANRLVHTGMVLNLLVVEASKKE
jgi:hypothetical protein